MKKIILAFLTIILFSGLRINAQDGVRPAVIAGFNLQNINGKNEFNNSLDNKLLPGYHAGVNVLIPIAPEIYFQPGILFSSKGAVMNEDNETKRRISYIEVPLNMVYRGQLGTNYVLLGLGPYVAYAVAGSYIVGDTKQDIDFKNDIVLWNPLALRRFDAGANIFAGYELESGIFLQVNAQLGLVKINPEINLAPDQRVWKNTGFGLSLGYRF